MVELRVLNDEPAIATSRGVERHAVADSIGASGRAFCLYDLPPYARARCLWSYMRRVLLCAGETTYDGLYIQVERHSPLHQIVHFIRGHNTSICMQ